MISVRKAGFTIIEVMLFLGISGLLFVGIIAGTSGAINVQRYHDSVASLQSILQQQYSETENVVNDNTTNICRLEDPGDPNPVAVNRGQSNCLVLGRFITTTDGSNLSVKNVIGIKDPTDPSTPVDDISALKQYKMQVSDVESSNYSIEWGAGLTDSSGTTSKGFSMLILRSPLSGVVRTFINDAPTADDASNLKNFLTTTALNIPVQLCVDSKGLFTGQKLAVKIDSNSTSASGVRVLGEADQLLTGNSICH